MLEPYVCCVKKFEEHYSQQSGSGLFYQGSNLQKGYGIGGIFRKALRTALPFLWKGAKVVGKEAVKTGSHIVNDILSGENFSTSVKKRTRETGKILADKALKKAQSMLGSGKYKRKRKTPKRIIPSKVQKVKRRDIFGAV